MRGEERRSGENGYNRRGVATEPTKESHVSGVIRSHRDLLVYQKAFSLANEVFAASRSFPREEMYALTNQIRRSSRSVCANLAEAWRKRRYEKHFLSTLNIAEGEAAETQVWIDFAIGHAYLSDVEGHRFDDAYEEVLRMLVAMINNPQKWCF